MIRNFFYALIAVILLASITVVAEQQLRIESRTNGSNLTVNEVVTNSPSAFEHTNPPSIDEDEAIPVTSTQIIEEFVPRFEQLQLELDSNGFSKDKGTKFKDEYEQVKKEYLKQLMNRVTDRF